MEGGKIKSVKIALEFEIEAKPERVFDALTSEVGKWWDHSFEDKPKGIFLEPKIGGRFFEDWGDGNGMLYATVTGVRRGKYLRIQGPMGMGGAVLGMMEYHLDPKGRATIVKLEHFVLGEISDETIAGYTQGWTQLLGTNMKNFAEAGEKVHS